MGFHKFTCVSQFSYDLTNMKCLKASQLSLLPGFNFCFSFHEPEFSKGFSLGEPLPQAPGPLPRPEEWHWHWEFRPFNSPAAGKTREQAPSVPWAGKVLLQQPAGSETQSPCVWRSHYSNDCNHNTARLHCQPLASTCHRWLHTHADSESCQCSILDYHQGQAAS